MKKILIINLFFVALIISSCSKDQKAVNQLKGEWEETEWNYSISFLGFNQSETIDPPEKRVYTFEKCKVKNEYCNGTLTIENSTNQYFTYTVQDEGETIEFVNNDGILIFELEKIDRNTRKIHLKDNETIEALLAGTGELDGLDFEEFGIQFGLTITLKKL